MNFSASVLFGKKTIFKEIQRVRPGEIIIKDGRIEKKSKINNLPQKIKQNRIIDESFIHKNLKESVKVHLRSDVPYCLFYSGGIDSTLIMYFMNILNLNQKISAYSVNFSSRTDTQSLKNVANQFNIEFNQNLFFRKIFGICSHLQQKILMSQ